MIEDALDGIIGVDDTHEVVITDLEGNPVDSQLIVDYGYNGSIVLVIAVIICLFKMIGGAFKK